MEQIALSHAVKNNLRLKGAGMSADKGELLLVFETGDYAHVHAADSTLFEVPLKFFSFGDLELVASGLCTEDEVRQRRVERSKLLSGVEDLPPSEARQLYDALAKRFAPRPG